MTLTSARICRPCRAVSRHDNFSRATERTTKESAMLAPSHVRSMWLLRFGMDWRICLVSSLPSALLTSQGECSPTTSLTRSTSWHPPARGGNINTGHMKSNDCMCVKDDFHKSSDLNKSIRNHFLTELQVLEQIHEQIVDIPSLVNPHFSSFAEEACATGRCLSSSL